MSGRAAPARMRRVDSDPVKVGALLREAGYRLDDGDPAVCWSLFDRHARLRRVHATYASGWRVTLVFYVDGSTRLSYAFKIAVRGGTKS